MHVHEIDPVTAEVIQMRCKNIVEEAATTIIRTSGSPVLTEAMDFATALFLPDGTLVSFSGHVVNHLGSSICGVEAVIRDFGSSVEPGDGFICNDPYEAGALHQGDVGIISPLFAENDQLVGWAFANAHVLDVGGMSPGGWAPEAWDCFAEGLRFPPMRIISKNRIIPEIMQVITRNVRLPGPVVNDIKSLIAANQTVQRRLRELLERYDVEKYQCYSKYNQELSEKLFRERIKSLRKGKYFSENWVEYDGHGTDALIPVRCTVEVSPNGHLHVDFTGSGKQIDGFVNAGIGPIRGIVYSLTVLALGWDIPVNDGIIRCISIERGPEGTVVHPSVPAPVSCGHMETASKAGKALMEALQRAIMWSDNPTLPGRMAAIGHLTWPGNSWVGRNQYGQYTAFAVMDVGSCGLGAQSTNDGLDIGAFDTQLNNGIPDVETNEALYPMLYLWRRINQNSGGPGRRRGGQGLDMAWTPWKTDLLLGTLENACAEVPSWGMAGGYPGSTTQFRVIRNTNVDDLLRQNEWPTHDTLSGETQTLRNHTAGVPLYHGDVFHHTIGGGGGLGDPLLRDPQRVLDDFQNGYIDLQMVKSAYGVVLSDSGTVDYEATNRERYRIRSTRVGHPVESVRSRDTDMRSLVIVNDHFQCNFCGHSFGSSSENWRDVAVQNESEVATSLARFNMVVQQRMSPEVRLVEYACPGCGYLLMVSVVVDGVNFWEEIANH